MNATLDEWIKQEAEILAANKRGVGAGFCTPQQLAGKTGLEILRGMMDGSLPVPYSARHENILAIEVDEGIAVFQGNPLIQHLNPAGTVHGGWMSNLADSTMGSAVLSALGQNKTIYVTSRLVVDYLRPMPRRVGRVRCSANINLHLSSGREIVSDACILDAEGVCYATAMGIYRVGRGAWA